MNIELLYFEDCPNYALLAPRLRAEQGTDGSVSAAGVEALDAQALAVRASGQAALLADLTGALNVTDQVLGEAEAQDRYAQLFVNVVDKGHLLASQLPETAEQHNGLPLPPKAGGRYGIAPVFRGEVVYDTGSKRWSVGDERFTTAPALKLADEMFWAGTWAGKQVEGPPALGLPYSGKRGQRRPPRQPSPPKRTSSRRRPNPFRPLRLQFRAPFSYEGQPSELEQME